MEKFPFQHAMGVAMLISQFWHDKLPKTVGWLKSDLPQLEQTQPAIWKAFCATSELSATDAKNAVDGDGPTLWFLKLGLSVAGVFDKSIGTRIDLSRDIADRFERDPGNATGQEFLRIVALHELCHWAWYQKKREDHDEAGEKFDAAIKQEGHKLDFSWLNGPTQPAPAPAIQVADLQNALARPNNPAHVGQPLPQLGKFTSANVAAGMPRGIRNNNPGNIRVGDPWLGLAEPAEMTDFQRSETAFCVFKEPEWGLRAMAVLLRNYQIKHDLRTIRQMIARWAPASDNNDTNGYATFVARKLNRSPDDAVDVLTAKDLIPMMSAMVQRENGMAPYGESQYGAAIALAN